jgi:hypothetical protein
MEFKFVEDSPELQAFAETLVWKTSINYEGSLYNYHTFDGIYFRELSNQYFKVPQKSNGEIYSEVKYRARYSDEYGRRIIKFVEVKPIEVCAIDWQEVRDQEKID